MLNRLGVGGTLVVTFAAVLIQVARAADEKAPFPLHDTGTTGLIDYLEYGYFTNIGTVAFQYVVTNSDGLAAVSGEGVDPNRSIYKDPAYLEMKKKGELEGKDPWSHVLTPHHQRDFFIWADAGVDPGVRQYFMAKILALAGHYKQAVKAYYAAMLFYPDSLGWSESGNFSWSVAQAALKDINKILEEHPDLGWRLVGADVKVDGIKGRMKVAVTPGKFELVKKGSNDAAASNSPDAETEDGPAFELYDPGLQDVIDYEAYGYFTNAGTRNFQYVVTNADGLAKVSGEGVDPNRSIYEDPAYLEYKKKGLLTGNWWAHTQSSDPHLDFFIWADAGEDPGVRQFFLAKILARAGHFMQALKAYYAALVFYPSSTCWSSGGEFEWSIADAAWNAIHDLVREHPELGVRLVDADVTTYVDDHGMHISVDPGHFEHVARIMPESELAETMATSGGVARLEDMKIIERRGNGKVQFVKYENGHWQMLVDGKPYFVKGVTYAPTMVGRLPWKWEWMWADENTNGYADVFEAWVDKNRNAMRDGDEPMVGDFKLLEDMGCNTIRFYYTNEDVNILLLRRAFHEHGIRVILGDFLGAYCHNSGASWQDGTDYRSLDQRKRMMAAIEAKVMKCRHEPWLLMYVLGNENNMPSTEDVNTTRTNGNKYPETYAKFLNDVAALIHRLDPDHPVGVGNLMTGLVGYYAKYAPNLDFIAVNSYVGPHGFGATWEKVARTMDRPVLISEYGCDSYWTDRGPDEDAQARYLMGCWSDIWYNRAGGPGVGNSIGGCVFEWLDEWWKDTRNYFKDPIDHQNTEPTIGMAFPDGASQEEWLGIMSQGDGSASPFLRIPKKAYYEFQRVWTK